MPMLFRTISLLVQGGSAPDSLERARRRVADNPSEAQREAGNFRKGHLTWKGLDITIEYPKGATRKGKSKDGKEWAREMKADYGYFKRTKARDGDHLDVYIGPNPDSDYVYIVNQVKPGGTFDEHKVVIGCASEAEARDLYLAHYPDNWTGLGSGRPMVLEDFKEWVAAGDFNKRAFVDGSPVQACEPLSSRQFKRVRRLLKSQRGEPEKPVVKPGETPAHKLAEACRPGVEIWRSLANLPQQGLIAGWYCPEVKEFRLDVLKQATSEPLWIEELEKQGCRWTISYEEGAPRSFPDRHWIRVGMRPSEAMLLEKEAYDNTLRRNLTHLGWIPGQGLGQYASPLTAALATGVLGAGVGYGAGALAESMLPERWQRGRLRRTLSILGGAAGSVVPLVALGAGNVDAGRSLYDPPLATDRPEDLIRVQPDGTFHLDTPSDAGLPPFTGSPAQSQQAYQELDQAFRKAGSLFTSGLSGPPPEIDVDSFLHTMWSDPRVGNRLPPDVRSATAALLQTAQTGPTVSMADLARLTMSMGTGWVAGALVGKTLGVLTGLPQETQDRLKQVGLWAGVVRSVIPGVFGG